MKIFLKPLLRQSFLSIRIGRRKMDYSVAVLHSTEPWFTAPSGYYSKGKKTSKDSDSLNNNSVSDRMVSQGCKWIFWNLMQRTLSFIFPNSYLPFPSFFSTRLFTFRVQFKSHIQVMSHQKTNSWNLFLIYSTDIFIFLHIYYVNVHIFPVLFSRHIYISFTDIS